APKVDSAIVRLVPHDTLPHPARDLSTLQAVVRTAFNARRKTLRKALAAMVTVDQLQSLGINDGLRPENLSLADFVKIADLVYDNKSSDSEAEEVSHD
ncbi:MAG: 16S rRNA (adenine(1518)-N(6)/adenine(1519)-N(6))-dimethyltransferase, partial [Gammaproteobacteria bacterium]